MKMKVETMGKYPKVHRHVTEQQVDVELVAEELENTRGQTVVCVNVNRADGKTARFWLQVRICGDSRAGKPGACYGTVSSRRNGNNDPSKSVSASWIDFEARRLAQTGGSL